MSTPATQSPPLASGTDDLADVLVIGGGPAGAWAALGATASSGAGALPRAGRRPLESTTAIS
ncbi:hypothetical protein [Sorangium sp. So ce1153]|uniref:hypothetical protein n=1 Tax=Sorangium sp. So ce1153 TaxID=3133333 RepID=UPI003F648B12